MVSPMVAPGSRATAVTGAVSCAGAGDQLKRPRLPLACCSSADRLCLWRLSGCEADTGCDVVAAPGKPGWASELLGVVPVCCAVSVGECRLVSRSS